MRFRVVLNTLAACALGVGLLVSAGHAEGRSLAAPTGPVLLTVTGAIEVTNTGDSASFDRAMLEALDWVTVESFTSFTQGVQVFSGPTLASLLEAVGATGGSIRATAINDYFVNIPISHAADHSVILAMDNNGKPMRIRDKGPIWVVYPLNENEVAAKPFDAEMIWQLNRMDIEG